MGLLLFLCIVTLKSQPLKLENAGTEHVYFSYHGEALFSSGTMSDFIFCAAEDAFDYKKWADWQAAHGMNHCRAYLPGSWTYVEYFSEENGGQKEILAYVSSPTGMENMEFKPNGAHVFLFDLPFPNGQYEARFFDPKSGSAGSKKINIKNGETRFRTPVFVDDLGVHIIN